MLEVKIHYFFFLPLDPTFSPFATTPWPRTTPTNGEEEPGGAGLLLLQAGAHRPHRRGHGGVQQLALSLSSSTNATSRSISIHGGPFAETRSCDRVCDAPWILRTVRCWYRASSRAREASSMPSPRPLTTGFASDCACFCPFRVFVWGFVLRVGVHGPCGEPVRCRHCCSVS